MARIEELKDLVSELMKADASTLDESTILNGLLASSMGRARLDARLRSQLGIGNSGVYTVQTFGELCRLLGIEGTSPAAMPTPIGGRSLAKANSFVGGVAVGVDIQSVADLPEESDYWEGDFYRQHFTPQEIAYALLQPNPRESFAAAWCAKEALRKADKRWAGVDWRQTEITHDADGSPMLRSGDEAIVCAVSLSHTDGFAVAVVAMAANPTLAAQAVPASPLPTPLPPAQPSVGESRLSLSLSVAALLVSLVAVAYSVLR